MPAVSYESGRFFRGRSEKTSLRALHCGPFPKYFKEKSAFAQNILAKALSGRIYLIKSGSSRKVFGVIVRRP
jgi:hypothetical protein